MKHSIALLFAAASLALAAPSWAMLGKDEFKAEQKKISEAYKADKDKCGALKANARDICMAEAKGRKNVANAALDASQKPSDAHTRKVQKAKAEADYDVAREKCDELDSKSKSACKKDAKAARDLATATAKKAAA